MRPRVSRRSAANPERAARYFNRRHVHDQRAGFGPAFSYEDPLDRGGIERIGAESVDGFGWKRNQTARADEFRGMADIGVGHESTL